MWGTMERWKMPSSDTDGSTAALRTHFVLFHGKLCAVSPFPFLLLPQAPGSFYSVCGGVPGLYFPRHFLFQILSLSSTFPQSFFYLVSVLDILGLLWWPHPFFSSKSSLLQPLLFHRSLSLPTPFLPYHSMLLVLLLLRVADLCEVIFTLKYRHKQFTWTFNSGPSGESCDNLLSQCLFRMHLRASLLIFLCFTVVMWFTGMYDHQLQLI